MFEAAFIFKDVYFFENVETFPPTLRLHNVICLLVTAACCVLFWFSSTPLQMCFCHSSPYITTD